jgi:hypothetical protein
LLTSFSCPIFSLVTAVAFWPRNENEPEGQKMERPEGRIQKVVSQNEEEKSISERFSINNRVTL